MRRRDPARRSPSATGRVSRGAGAARSTVVDGPPDGTAVRRAAPASRRGASGPDGLVVLGSGSDPAGHGGRPAGVRRGGRAARPARPSRTTATRPTSSRSPGREPPDGLPRPRHRQRRCRAGSAEVAGYRGRRPAPALAAPGSTSTRRSTRCSLATRADWRPAAAAGILDRRGRARWPRVRRGRPRSARASSSWPAARRRPGLAWLERTTASRTRALIEERGFRTRAAGQRPVRSSLGLLLDRDGPGGARRDPRRARRRGARRHAGSCSPTASAPTSGLARRRGPLRERPPAAGPDRRSVAPRADRGGARCRRSRSSSAATASSGRASGWRSERADRGPEARPRPGPRTSPSDPVLLAAIRDEIAATGPMTFARFMEIALYDPARGYYRGAVARPGRAGDFLTAPEASPIFGRTLARFARGGPRGDRRAGHVHDPRARGGDRRARRAARRGAARGRAAARRPSATSSTRSSRPGSTRSATALARASRGGVGRTRRRPADRRPRHRQRGPRRPADPPRRPARRAGSARSSSGSARTASSSMSRPTRRRPALAARLAAESIELADGQHAEICLAIDAWIGRAAAGLGRGVLLLIDYGHPAAELYDPRRRAAGTLATYLGHRVGDDPYRAIGRQDLTAHVDVTAVERAAVAAGLDHLGTTTQAEFLARLGAGELLVAEQTRPGREPPGLSRDALGARPDDRPGAMGRFRVLAFGAAAIGCCATSGLRRPPRCASRRDRAPCDRARPCRTPRQRSDGPAADPWTDRRERGDAARAATGRPLWLHAQGRPPPRNDGSACPGDGAHRRGADRELARALGAIRSPIRPVDSCRRRPARRAHRARAEPRTALSDRPARHRPAASGRPPARGGRAGPPASIGPRDGPSIGSARRAQGTDPGCSQPGSVDPPAQPERPST